MPHPENHIVVRQHPRHSRGGGGEDHLGLQLFENGVQYAKRR
jgi:phosphoribosylformylglycinamidine (FGAM) synthase-like amidotransferase family enzyme